MIWRILRKDWALLWPLAVLVAAIQAGYEWADYKSGFFGTHPVAGQIVQLLTVAWFVGIVALAVAVVHEDAIPGVDQDWLVRPLRRGDLLAAKLLFALVTVCVPMLVLNVANELALGFPFSPSFAAALYKEFYVFVCLIVPAMAVAAATRNMGELFILAAGIVVLYAANLWLGSMVLGANRCPTCDSAVSWLQHLLQHVGVLFGSVVILALQYYQRRTVASRAVALVGVLILVFAQLPWNVAFAIQSWLAGSSGLATSVALTADLPAARVSPGKTATVLNVPLAVTAVPDGAFLVADRAQFTLVDRNGTVLYRGTNPGHGSVPLVPDHAESAAGPGTIRQALEIPNSTYARIASRIAGLSMNYSLTLMTLVAGHRLNALDGEVRANDLGVCQSKAETNALRVRCKQIGRAPVCYEATLYGARGEHNPPVLASDYRPYIPAPANILAFTGFEMATRDPSGLAHFPVDSSDLGHAYIDLKVYAPREHFRRRLNQAATASPPEAVR